METKKTIKLIVMLSVIVSVIFQSCTLEPLAWNPPVKPELVGAFAENDLLNKTEWIDLEGWYGPEDIAIDKEGNLYCGARKSKTDFSDGAILKIDTNGCISTFCKTDSWVTGLHFDSVENLIVCDPERGLISVDKKGEITTLIEEDENGNKFLIPNDVDIARDGMIYFSNTSNKYESDRKNARKLILEMRADGGLYLYNPFTKKVSTLIDGTFFGNGVAVSQNDDFVLIVELAKYRVLRYWLKGEKKGGTDIFLENLPGFPNGISRRQNGTFWLGFTTKRNDRLDNIHSNPGLKKFIWGVPQWLQPKGELFGMIMNVSESGEIIKTYYDTTGKYVSEASSIEENNGYLYLGGDLTGYIGKYKLE